MMILTEKQGSDWNNHTKKIPFAKRNSFWYDSPVSDIIVLDIYNKGVFYGKYGLGKNRQEMEGVLACNLERWDT
jgi:hypothetical protein